MTVAVKAKIHPPVHAPGILVEIVGLQTSCRRRSCKEHELCRDEVLKEDVVVCCPPPYGAVGGGRKGGEDN
jgi:hypothetical protein